MAVRLIVVRLQVSSVEPVLFVMPAVGAVVFRVMVTASVSVQPLAEVTVTVYVAGAVTDNAASVPTSVVPFDHE